MDQFPVAVLEQFTIQAKPQAGELALRFRTMLRYGVIPDIELHDIQAMRSRETVERSPSRGHSRRCGCQIFLV